MVSVHFEMAPFAAGIAVEWQTVNFDFSSEQKQLGDAVRRFLADNCASNSLRAVVDGDNVYDSKLWNGIADMGLLGIAIPEKFGGSGAGYLELCVVAEEMGRALAPVPFSSTVYLATEAILLAGSDAQKHKWLPMIASGAVIGTLALFERTGSLTPRSIEMRATGDRLDGIKGPVPDATSSDIAIVAARTGSTGDETDISLFIVDLREEGVERRTLTAVDPSREQGEIRLSHCMAEPLGVKGDGWRILSQLLDRAAVLFAFEQTGGADRTLQMARDYALDRVAFARPIGSFQAIKHMLADMYVATTLARSNCYYGAWALSSEASELPGAAAAARLSATQAFQSCAKNNIQVHGGTGYTWEFDCHLYYRRSNALALALGGPSHWENLLIEAMLRRNAA